MNRSALIFTTLLWSGVIVFGLSKLIDYENTPGPSRTPRTQWPAGSLIPHVPGRVTLVMFAHPQCPCSRAGLIELARVMGRCRSPITVCVLFYKPGKAPAGWEKTALYDQAAAIPGVQVRTDEEGVEARRLHATTSGHTLLFDADGRLLFSGGITDARGREGAGGGGEALVALLNAGKAKATRTPVFGCSLLGAVSP